MSEHLSRDAAREVDVVFDPGAGWQTLTPTDGEAPIGTVAFRDPDGSWRYWVRDVPVPPLPTEPGWYANTKHFGVLFLRKDGYWLTASGSTVRPENIQDRNLVLMEPRAVTARAVLDWVRPMLPEKWYQDAAKTFNADLRDGSNVPPRGES